MTQLPLFEPEITIPHSDLRLLVACNNAPSNWLYKKAFYQLKNVILEKYAEANGHDLQVIKVKCHSCDGTGWYYSNTECHNCYKGLYDTVHIALKRYILNGLLFYKPMGKVHRETGKLYIHGTYMTFGEPLTFTQTIQGLVTHDIPDTDWNYAYVCLLYKYSRVEYTTYLRQFSKSLNSYDRKRWGECAKNSSNIFECFAIWYGLTPVVDDLTF